MRRLLVVLFLAASLGTCQPDARGTPPTANLTRPNIVLVLSDDATMAAPDFMPYLASRPEGNWIEFDHLIFNDPLCCPSRATILTGLYSHHTGVEQNNEAGSFDDSSTLPVWLRGAGYETALVGKYLNGYPWDKGVTYVPPGWDHAAIWKGSTGDPYFNYDMNVNGALEHHGTGAANYSTDVFADDAVGWLEDAQAPYFLMFTPKGPHAPFTPAKRHKGTYDGVAPLHSPAFNEADVTDKPAWVRDHPSLDADKIARMDRDRTKGYEALLSIDEAMARMVATVTQRGELDNTIFVVMTDNGLSLGEHRVTKKNNPYEDAVRTRMFVRFPGAAQRTESALVSNVDLAPTFAAWAGVSHPPVDGHDLSPLLSQSGTSIRDDVLIHAKAKNNLGQGMPTWWGLRTERWKWIEYDNGERELYDLTADPYELVNLADDPAHASTVVALAARTLVLRNEAPS